MIQDTSNLKGTPYEYRLFLAWKTITAPTPGFDSYHIYRSEDGTNFTRLDRITDRTTNYYDDNSTAFDTQYWYRVSSVDSLDNESFTTETIAASANGIQDGSEGGGGDDSVGPIISNIATTSPTIYSNQASIFWDTNEISDSVISYSNTLGLFILHATSTAMRDNDADLGQHEIVLYNLMPAATYYFRVESNDPSGNHSEDDNSGDGYSFTTTGGPVILNVTITDVGNTEATINWSTDIPADSYVYYSSSSDLSNALSASDLSLDTNHAVALSGLEDGLVYYFRVESNDTLSRKAVDSNQGNYYSFVTDVDAAAPALVSGPAVSPRGDTYATISWTTDESATSRVEYGTVSGVYPLNSNNSGRVINHSLTITSLTADTIYYYRVISADKNGNTYTGTEQTFTTRKTLYDQDEVDDLVDDAQGETVVIHEGGGIVVVDKTDKVAPEITNVKVSEIKSDSATVGWATDEETNGVVEYSQSPNGYSFLSGDLFSSSLVHSVVLNDLSPLTTYSFRAISTDKGGNISGSNFNSFATLSQSAEELQKAKEELSFDEVMKLSDEKSVTELYQFATDAMGKAMDIFSQISGQISINQMESTLGLSKEKLELLAKNIPAPLLSGEPKVITTAKTATIAWQTNKDSNSLVAYSPEENYSASAENPYQQVVGNHSDKTIQHVVTIHELTPDTLYHYQVRSQAEIGPESASPDFVLRTDKEILDIKNYVVEIISPEEAIFRWVTNVEADSQIRYTPYRNNILTVDETRTKAEKAITTIHEISLKDFESGVMYKIELASQNLEGVSVVKEIDYFSTAKDDLPPVISEVKTSSALSTGASAKVQTIIFWKTNELSTGQVFWAEGLIGANGKLTEAVRPDNNYSREHTAVITKFEPGKIYTFRVESADSSGNKSISQNFTILAPRQKESVFQIIMKSLEEAFGWVGNIRK